MPTSPPANIPQLVTLLLDLINLSIAFVLGLTFLYIVWKIIDAWIINAGDESKREEGKRLVVIAVLVIVVMVSVWGIVWLIKFSIFG